MIKRADIIEEALTWEGVKWRHQGRSRNGIDCAGVPIMVGNGLGLISYNPVDYPRRPDGTFLSHFDKCLLRKRVRDIKPGDVIIFNDHYHPCHCGIVATKHGEVSVIHAHAGRGRVIHERLSEARSVVGRPVRAYEFPGLED